MRANPWLLAAVLLLAAVTSCKRSGNDRQAATATPVSTSSFAFSVRTVPIKQGRLVAERSISARVDPVHDSLIAANLGGRVVKVLVEVGDQVEKGQPLVQLDDRGYQNQLENARLSLQRARLNLKAAEKRVGEQQRQLESQRRAAADNLELTKKRLEEVKALYQVGGVAANDLRQLEVALEQAKASFAAADAAYQKWLRAHDEDLQQLRLQVEQAAVAVKQAEQAVADALITAPFAGQIADRFVEVGTFVGPGTPTVRLVAGPQEVSFKLPPDDVARLISQGLRLQYLGHDYPLELLRTAPIAGRDLLIEVSAKPPPNSNLPLGAAGTVYYSLLVGEGSLIPVGALRSRDGQTVVFAIEDGKAAAYPVKLIGESQGQAVVSGLPEGLSRVIFPLPQDLTAGTAVEVVQ